ncbi:hypothetical protein DSD19_04730 [Rhodovulum sp. BSW8]|nr:hypothetical protein DSD19_04730 [Rhodovulum sp. BSW8]
MGILQWQIHEMACTADGPLFGQLRVERWLDGGPWFAYGVFAGERQRIAEGTFNGGFQTAEEAMAAVDAKVLTALRGIQTNGVAAIADERRRQIEVEGWTPEHDDAHDEFEMSLAAAAYAVSGTLGPSALLDQATQDAIRKTWPFQAHLFRPTGGRKDLVRAGALIAAEIDRLDRAALRQEEAANA